MKQTENKLGLESVANSRFLVESYGKLWKFNKKNLELRKVLV